MKYLSIKNTGLLDIRLISLLGGTTKTGKEFKIGRFGTGLKYVLAFLFRNNIDFKIFVGEKEVKLHTETEIIQDTKFEIIYIDGQRTSITTQMGMDWQTWMIIREIWCNAMDEGGHEKEETNFLTGYADTTTFFIQITSEVKDVLDNWGKYFIHEVTPMYENERFAIYQGGKDLRIYKQGVLIHSKENVHALFNYDIKNAYINELREYQGFASMDIYHALCHADKKIAEYAINNMTEQNWEGKDMDWSWSWAEFSQGWYDAIGNAKIITQKAVNDIKARGVEIDLTETMIVPKPLFTALSRQYQHVSALRVADAIGEFYEVHDEKLNARTKQALAILENCNYFIHPELKFIFGVFGDKNVLAKVHLDKKEILISEKMGDKSMFEMCGMLIEENEHFKTGYTDCSRDFQTHFIHLFTKTLLEKHEVTL